MSTPEQYYDEGFKHALGDKAERFLNDPHYQILRDSVIKQMDMPTNTSPRQNPRVSVEALAGVAVEHDISLSNLRTIMAFLRIDVEET